MRDRGIIIWLVMLFSILTEGENSMSEPQMNGQFELYVIADRLIDALPYNYNDPAWQKLLETPPNGAVILADQDIESYNWEAQEIVLSPQASDRLNRLELREKSFVAYLANRPLFGGAFIERASARAIDYPVIYIDQSQSQVVFKIRPTHVLLSYRQLDGEIKSRIELTDVKNHFRALGKLR